MNAAGASRDQFGAATSWIDHHCWVHPAEATVGTLECQSCLRGPRKNVQRGSEATAHKLAGGGTIGRIADRARRKRDPIFGSDVRNHLRNIGKAPIKPRQGILSQASVRRRAAPQANYRGGADRRFLIGKVTADRV